MPHNNSNRTGYITTAHNTDIHIFQTKKDALTLSASAVWDLDTLVMDEMILSKIG